MIANTFHFGAPFHPGKAVDRPPLARRIAAHDSVARTTAAILPEPYKAPVPSARVRCWVADVELSRVFGRFPVGNEFSHESDVFTFSHELAGKSVRILKQLDGKATSAEWEVPANV